jgi:hypothetical protein
MIDWDSMYLSARSMNIQPSEFWEMTLGELLLEIGHRVESMPRKKGQFTQEEADELLRFAHGAS